MITKANIVSAELRKLADALDANPDADVVRPFIHFYGEEKNSFLATVKALPRPLKKKLEDNDSKYRRLQVEYDSPGMWISASIPQSLTCELIAPARPAVYRCDPLLSQDEEEAVTV